MFFNMVNVSSMLGAGLIIVESFMLFLWFIYLFNRRICIVDIGWGLSFIIMAAICFVLGDGYIWRKWLVMAVVSTWALRLVYYISKRFQGKEDPRYILLTDSLEIPLFGKIQSKSLKVLFIYLIQGLLVVVLSFPFALMCNNAFFFFEPSEVFGLLIWMMGLVGEAVADRELFQFKQNPENHGLVCEKGFWYHSRHPNYFFEWVVWVGYFIMASSSPGGWLAVISPLLMLFLLTKVSGIPWAEVEALRTKGEAYQVYQRHTSVFFPWFKKR